MTKSTITREQLRALAVKKIESLKFAITQSAYTGIRCRLKEELQLAEFALAAMDSEPVAWTDEEELRDANESGSGYLFGIERDANKFADPRRQIMLYRHAQPAPVVPLVPDDVSGPLAHAYKELTPTFMRNHIAVFERYGIAPNDSSTVIQALRIALDGIERRAAMLQAEPVTTANKLGNSPVIPDTWIPVSERMPEWGDYLVTDGTDFDVQLFNGEEFIPGFIWEDKITHWMPLPATPQEVKP